MATKKPKPLFTKADVFYVRQHMDKTDPKVIAKDLDKPVALVRKQIEILMAEDRRAKPTEAKAEEPKPAEPVPGKEGKFVRQSGSVSMTQGQSMDDDEAPKGPNNAWFERYKKNIHFIKPKK